jgi:predicted lipoprotein
VLTLAELSLGVLDLDEHRPSSVSHEEIRESSAVGTSPGTHERHDAGSGQAQRPHHFIVRLVGTVSTDSRHGVLEVGAAGLWLSLSSVR